MSEELFDAVIVGGGPSGATAACDLAKAGFKRFEASTAPSAAPARASASAIAACCC